MSSLWPTHNRWIRYGAPVALVIVSVLFAAVDVNRVGNDVQLIGTAVGLVWLIATLGRDMGMGTSSGRRSHVPDPPPAEPTPTPTSTPTSRPPRRPRGDDDQPPVSPS